MNASDKLMWRTRLRVLAVLIFSFLSFNASAVVDANSNSNTTAPNDGVPWANVGAIGGASGVYLGGGWVLTASHVGVGNIILAGSTFTPDGDSLRLTNSDGSVTDLMLYHLTSAPPLPSLPLVTTTPPALSSVDLVGFGLIAGSAQTNLGVYTGFYWSGSAFKSWGNNKVDLGGTSTIDIGYGKLSALSLDFTSPGTLGPTSQTSDEAQVAPGDSGGGLFYKNGTTWQLAGILDAQQTQLNQPGGTSAYGDKTYAADIATYRNEIMSVLNSSPVPALSITLTGTNTLIHWLDNGLSYTLQASISLGASDWTTVSQNQVSTNGQVWVQLPATNLFRSFRLRHP